MTTKRRPRYQRERGGQPRADAAGLCRRAAEAIGRSDWAGAESLYQRVLAQGVVDANVYNNLATLYDRQGIKPDESLALLVKAHQLAPVDSAIEKNLVTGLGRKAAALAKEGRFREALPWLEQRAALDPHCAPYQREVGYCYAQLGDLATALRHYARAINLAPTEATYYNDFGLACYELRLLAEAKGAFQRVLELRPDSVVAYVHLGLLANLAGLPAVAVNMLERAVAIDPECAEAHNNLALFLRSQGLQAECRRHYQQAVALKPESTDIYSGYLLSLNDDPNADPVWVAAEHRKFQTLIKGALRPVVTRDPTPGRKLRVGYLSPDLQNHSVAFFILPVLRAHDPAKVEVVAYSTSNVEDALTAEIRTYCAEWRSAYRMPDEELAQLIIDDGIDILVELSGHTKDNRLIMVARRAAPVQMTYLGYPNTTGLAEMDFRITDEIADPPGVSDGWHSEKLVRIEGGFLAFAPDKAARELPVAPLPAEQVGVVTFGSFNNLAKINEGVLDTWASILAGVQDGVLLLKAKGLRDERIQERIREAFHRRGIDADKRVVLACHERAKLDHLRLYHRIDLALDTFPYNGTTTTCEALWMGTPVLTLLGRSHPGRVGASILGRVGLEALVCESAQVYIETAIALGKEPERIRALRTGLRERFLASPVMDAKRMASALEVTYAMAWRDYCQATPSLDGRNMVGQAVSELRIGPYR